MGSRVRQACCLRQRTELTEGPEWPDQTEPIEDRLVLPSRVWLPVRGETVSPPGIGELAQFRDRERGSRLSTGEPAPEWALCLGQPDGGDDERNPPTIRS